MPRDATETEEKRQDENDALPLLSFILNISTEKDMGEKTENQMKFPLVFHFIKFMV